MVVGAGAVEAAGATAVGGDTRATGAGTVVTVGDGADGIGTVAFGLPKVDVVDDFSALFGPPTWRGINRGCGARWTEVVWHDLAAEFRDATFSGYRYSRNARGLFSIVRRPQAPNTTLIPRLATAEGITLGSTLAAVRAVYTLHLAGAGKWHSDNRIVFVSDAQHSPAPLSSRIIEIKSPSTCGDF